MDKKKEIVLTRLRIREWRKRELLHKRRMDECRLAKRTSIKWLKTLTSGTGA